MDQLFTAIQNLIPSKYQPLALAILVLLPRGLYAWKNGASFGGGLMAMFLGSATPSTSTTPSATPANPPAPKIPLMILATAAMLSLTLSACSTNQQTAVYKSATAVQTTVEVAMTAWGNYVRTGNATDAQRVAVAQAYNKYQLAMLAVIDVEEALGTVSAGSDTNAIGAAQGQLQTASAQASQAVNDLVALVQSFGIKF